MNAQFLSGWRWMAAVGGASVVLMAFDNSSPISAQIAGPAKAGTELVRTTNGAPPLDEPTGVTDASTVSAAPVPSAETGAPPPLPPSLKDMSPGMAEIVKLAQSGVGESVLLAYIDRSTEKYNPTVDEILYLTDLGVPETVITALVRGTQSTGLPPSVTPPAQVLSPAAVAVTPPAPVVTVTNAIVPEEHLPESQAVAFETEPVDVNYFYSSLAPYGSWIYLSGSGYCWQPTVCATTPGWRPYGNRGRWLYTDCGWYWQSDYSWGWAAFHYGRWDHHASHGWVWCPGSTWGPSWVTWRVGAGHSGWAPLPSTVAYDSRIGFTYRGSHLAASMDLGFGSDHYTFVPTARFVDGHPYDHRISSSRAAGIFQNTTVINNYNTDKRNWVVNEGIARDHIAGASHTDIRTVAIHDQSGPSHGPGRRELVDHNNTLQVRRPRPVGSTSGVPADGSAAKFPQMNRRVTSPTPVETVAANSDGSVIKFPDGNRRIVADSVPSNGEKLTPSPRPVRTQPISGSPVVYGDIPRHNSPVSSPVTGSPGEDRPSVTRPGPRINHNPTVVVRPNPDPTPEPVRIPTVNPSPVTRSRLAIETADAFTPRTQPILVTPSAPPAARPTPTAPAPPATRPQPTAPAPIPSTVASTVPSLGRTFQPPVTQPLPSSPALRQSPGNPRPNPVPSTAPGNPGRDTGLGGRDASGSRSSAGDRNR